MTPFVRRKKLEALKDDPELAAVFEDIKNSGAAAMERYWNDTDLMTKISQKMGALGVTTQPSKPTKHIPVRSCAPHLTGDVKRTRLQAWSCAFATLLCCVIARGGQLSPIALGGTET